VWAGEDVVMPEWTSLHPCLEQKGLSFKVWYLWLFLTIKSCICLNHPSTQSNDAICFYIGVVYCTSVYPVRGTPPLMLFLFPLLMGVFSFPIWGSKDRGCCMLYRLLSPLRQRSPTFFEPRTGSVSEIIFTDRQYKWRHKYDVIQLYEGHKVPKLQLIITPN